MKRNFYAILLILLIYNISCRSKTYRMEIKLKTVSKESNNIKFITGLGVGYGLSVEASEELKNCFIKNEKTNNNIVNKFFAKTKTLKRKNQKDKKQKVFSFTSEALNFFAKFKNCNPVRETIFTFIKQRIINIGMKGLAYAIGGPLGLLIKSGYHLFKFLSEMKTFYHLRAKKPIDYYSLGSSVGKVVYYTQNLMFRRRRR